MKLLAIAILCLSLALADETKNSSSIVDQLDVVELGKNDAEVKSSEVQKKRDAGYSYTRPDRFSPSQRHESSGIRGRIVTKYPSSQTIRPFNRYGPPKQSASQFGKPSSQYAPQHQQSGPHNRYPQSNNFGNQAHQFSDGQNSGQTHQEIPSPIRTYDFAEPSPIASQNNEPFNSNAASYLPPRNQKLPGYSNSQTFSNHQKNNQNPEDHRIQTTRNQEQHQQQSQTFNNNFQSQSLLQGPFQDHSQISDAAIFLAQNAQAISQLYDAPAANLNYEPIPNFQASTDQMQNPNNQFQTFDVNAVSQGVQSAGFEDSRGFRGTLPSYASGILDSQQALQQIQSLEKDRLIDELQRALVTAQHRVKADDIGTTTARYAQNHATGSYVQSQKVASIGTQINPSIGPQLDKPNSFNSQRPFGGVNTAFGPYLPGTGTTSAIPFTYGLPSTTPSTQSPSTTTTTTVSSTATSTTPQRPVQGFTGDGSSQVPNSVSPPGTSVTYPFTQYGGFVPTLIGTNLVNYPTYGTNFLASGQSPLNPGQSSGSSPTHFGIPIPTVPAANPGTGTSTSGSSFPQKPQAPAGHHPQSGPPIYTNPVQPIQPIHPIASTPVHTVFPVVPSVSQVHPVQNPVPVTPGHPAYGLQPAVVNPLLLKPVKAVYPVYYYPNVYQLQKPAVPSHPWSYAPSYAAAKPTQIWK